VKAIAEVEYPRKKLQIQVLTTRTDETVRLAEEDSRKIPARFLTLITSPLGFALASSRGTRNGMKTAKANCLPSSTPTSFPSLIVCESWSLLYRSMVGCAQMRWSHINALHLLTRLQTIMLDGHFVVGQLRAIAWWVFHFTERPEFGDARP